MPNLKGKILILALLIEGQYIQRTMGCGASSNIKAAGTPGKGKRTSSSTSRYSNVKHHPNEKTKSQTKSSKVSILFLFVFHFLFPFFQRIEFGRVPNEVLI